MNYVQTLHNPQHSHQFSPHNEKENSYSIFLQRYCYLFYARVIINKAAYILQQIVSKAA
jgi:hypothetical protein